MSVDERLQYVEELLEQTNSWITQQLKPGIRSLKEAMQTQITALRTQLEEEQALRLALQKELQSRPDRNAIAAMIAEQIRQHTIDINHTPLSSSSTSTTTTSTSNSKIAQSVAATTPKSNPLERKTITKVMDSEEDLFGMPSPSSSNNNNNNSFSNKPSPKPSPASTRPHSSYIAPGTSFIPTSNAPSSNTSSSSSTSSAAAASPALRQSKTVSELEERLKSQGLDRYYNALLNGGIKTLQQLSTVDVSQLSRFGVSLLTHKQKFEQLILALQVELDDGDDDNANNDELFPGPSPTPSSSSSSSSAYSSSSATTRASVGSGIGSSDNSSSASRTPVRSTPTRSDSRADLAAIAEAVRDVRDDNTDTDWLLLVASSSGVALEATGNGGFDEFINYISEGKIQYALLRLIQGDQESRRVKFVFVRWVGPSCPGILKAKANTMKSDVVKLLGQYHVELFVEDLNDLTYDKIVEKIKAAAGADYDQGNKGGYSSSASSLKARALDTYRNKEREATITKPVFNTSALPSQTPCDISHRPMVAPPSAARANIIG